MAASSPIEETQQSSLPAAQADTAEQSAADLERQPLLDKPKEQRRSWWPFSGEEDKKAPRKSYFGAFFSGTKANTKKKQRTQMLKSGIARNTTSPGLPHGVLSAW